MTPVLEPMATIQAAQFVNVITRAEVTHGYRLDLPEEGATFAPGFAVRRAPDGTLGLAVVVEEPKEPRPGDVVALLSGADEAYPHPFWNPMPAEVRIVSGPDADGDFVVEPADDRASGRHEQYVAGRFLGAKVG